MSRAGTVRLDDQLCFALYAASSAVIRLYRPLLSEIGITYTQYLVLMVLWQRDGATVSEVAERLQQSGHAITPVLARLERLGLVTRDRDRLDARVVRVSLTASGAELESRAASVQRQVVCGTGLDDEQLVAARTWLQSFVDDMHASAACEDHIEGEAS